MKPRIMSEEDFDQLCENVRRRDRDMIEPVRGGRGCETPYRASGSRREPAIPKTTSRRSESAPSPSKKSPYDSKWEAAYHAKLQLELQAGLIKQIWLHPFSLWLPGGIRYKPDFMVQYPSRAEAMDLEIIEVKGWSKNRRDGITRLKIAAALFPCFTWRMVYKTKGGGWDGEYL